MTKKALYLAGGGARGAYQAGVLKGLSKILDVKKVPFDIISGVSVGSINAAILAENATDFPLATKKLDELWRNITSQQVFNASNYELSKSVFRNLSNIFVKNAHAGHLLDTEPLHAFIDQYVNFDAIFEHIEKKHFEAMEVISNCYETHQTVSFYHHCEPASEDWNYPRHISRRVKFGREHILASGSLPLFFPPIKIDGFHFGDGSIGLVTPLRGVVRFQVDKILILGTRPAPVFSEEDVSQKYDIGFAQILGGMLNGLFLDNLDRDIEMLNRMNEIARLLSIWKKHRSPWRPIETLHLRPSIDIAGMAQNQYNNMPALLRFLLNLLGAKSHSGDLLSFLLFEKSFTVELIKLGYKDTMASSEAILQFFKN